MRWGYCSSEQIKEYLTIISVILCSHVKHMRQQMSGRRWLTAASSLEYNKSVTISKITLSDDSNDVQCIWVRKQIHKFFFSFSSPFLLTERSEKHVRSRKFQQFNLSWILLKIPHQFHTCEIVCNWSYI